MATGDSAYFVSYKGEAIAAADDEAFAIKPRPEITAPVVVPMFRSASAAIFRPSLAQLWRYEITAHLIRDDLIDVVDAVDELIGRFANLDEAGQVLVTQGATTPTTVYTIDDAWLESVRPELADQPARARVAPVTLSFVTNTDPTAASSA